MNYKPYCFYTYSHVCALCYELYDCSFAVNFMLKFIGQKFCDVMDACGEIQKKLKEVLPFLTDNDSILVLNTLNELGVEQWDDMKHVEEGDLNGVLKPIQARKLLTHVKSCQPNAHSSSSTEPALSRSSSESGFGYDDWDVSFEIPWEKFPRSLVEDCKQKKRPAHRDRLQMIRVIVDDVHQLNKAPKKRNFERIAEKIVHKYPSSFKDVVGDVVIGTGLQSLASQLMYRSGNIKCATKAASKNLTMDVQNQIDDEVSNVSSIVEELKTCYSQKEREYNKVLNLMKRTFKSQRCDIKNNTLISEMKFKWPFLFEEQQLFQHYELLMMCDNAKEQFLEKLAVGSDKIFK